MAHKRHKLLYFGTFFAGFGFLAFELFRLRISAVVVNPHMVFVGIAIAMLGTNCATAFISTRDSNFSFEQEQKRFACMCLSLVFSMFAMLTVILLLNDTYNAKLVAAVESGGLEKLIAGAFMLDPVTGLLLPYPIIVKAAVVMLFIFPLGILMRHLLPQGLRLVERDNKRLMPRAWAINGAASTIGASLGITLSQPLGFRAIFFVSTFFYGSILTIGTYRNGKAPSL